MNKKTTPEKKIRIGKSILDAAKAFLCWDMFPDLTIRLIQLQESVSYFHPPNDRSTIVLFCQKDNRDYSIPLFLLFHEIGHYIQYEQMKKAGTESLFWQHINTPTGKARSAFEQESWQKGKVYFNQFIEKNSLHPSILSAYDQYAKMSTESYHDLND
ncbi:hypothetical protein JW824_05595 [bacterium]|nr:hypothetical protein [bacterium]RQV96350.1 MAG: hypothetical protein EH221_05105 [bacterium]